MENVGDRIRMVRKDADLSMESFGRRIGINKSSVSGIENGRQNPAERTLKLISREFHVNYDWLSTGEGEIYSNVGHTVLEMLVDEYDLCDMDRQIMEMYLMLTDEQRAGIRAFVNGMIEASVKKKQGQE